MSIFFIKIVAYITMFLDHIKYVLPDTNCFITEFLGRISYPLFAFLITEGYIHTKDLGKYYKRLIILAIISQIPFMLFRTFVGNFLLLNILVTLLLGLIAINIYDKIENKILGMIICVLFSLLGEFIRVDYGWYGVAVIILFYIFRKNINYESNSEEERKNKFVNLMFLNFLFILLNIVYILNMINWNVNLINNYIIKYFVCIMLSLIFINLYNGKQGRKTGYMFYAIYPVHLLILYIIGIS